MRHIQRAFPIPQRLWEDVTREVVILKGLDASQLARLRELTTWFLHSKAISGAQGLDVTMRMRIIVAAQACLLILNLETDYFESWVEVILYPGAFRVQHEQVDEYGIVHAEARALSGRSWLQGPVILSWEDVEQDACRPMPGHNVVIHEFAHKLDGLNGVLNGMPPLHLEMSLQSWAHDFSVSYYEMNRQVEEGGSTLINPYALSSPAEFFAVLSEYFFTAPEIVERELPAVYGQLAQFYRIGRR
jgi:MtfA peptidase